MRRTTTLAALTALTAALALVPHAPAGATAAATCEGRVATTVVAPPAQPGGRTAPVTGTPGNDVIVGTEADDTIDGVGGDDVVCGLGGADTLVGGDGADRLFAGADAVYHPDDGYYGDLVVPGAGDDHVDLGSGEEDIWFWESPLEVDQVSYADSPAAVRVDLAAGTATGHGTDTIVTGVPGRPIGMIGSAHDDTLLGSSGPDVVAAGAGDDTVETGGSADTVRPDDPGRTDSGFGFDAHDPVPQAGDDVVSTGPGSDGVHVQRGADVVRGGGDVDRLTSDSPERGTRLLGGGGKDRLGGGAGAVLLGQSGNDQLDALLDGRRGASTWNGGAGRDRLTLTVARSHDIDRLVVHVPRRRVTADRTRAGSIAGFERVTTLGRIPLAGFVGGRAGEWFESSAGRVRAAGGRGSDRLSGSPRSDVLDGGAGRDRLDAGPGRDRCLRGERLSSCELRR